MLKMAMPELDKLIMDASMQSKLLHLKQELTDAQAALDRAKSIMAALRPDLEAKGTYTDAITEIDAEISSIEAFIDSKK